MTTPVLFLRSPHTRFDNVKNHLVQSTSYAVIDKSNETDWLPSLLMNPPEVCLIDVDDIDHETADKIIKADIPSLTEMLLISNGEPNPDIDSLMLAGAAFHFRTPVDEQQIQDTLDDIAGFFNEPGTKGKSVVTSDLDQYGLLVGSSGCMHRLYRTLHRVAKSNANVLIIGESGSGKELVANTIHLASERSAGPFVAVNCGAISPELVDSELFGHEKGAFTGAQTRRDGLFEQARGGTLFLDEVTEMPLEHQVKLLRVLEAGEFRRVGGQQDIETDIRVIAATNRDIPDAIEQDVIREDLYFRLSQFPVNLPPLRERGDDIVGLARHFIAHRNAEENTGKSITDSALEKIASHPWPGNVRELKHAVERAFILADDIIDAPHLILEADHQQGSMENTIPAKMPLEDIERMAIENTLRENDGNKTESAQDLGISVKTLYNKLEKYDKP